MGHRQAQLSLGARLAWALAVIALGLVAVSVLATRAQAGLDPVGGDDVARVSAAMVPAHARQAPRKHHAHRRAARSEPQVAEVANAAGEPLDVTDGSCRENLAVAAKHGLVLPDGWKLYCVGPGLDWNGASHWGVTCPYDDCPEGAGPYVSISNPTYYVVAHELCHANFGNDELMADACAEKHGASLATSPYN